MRAVSFVLLFCIFSCSGKIYREFDLIKFYEVTEQSGGKTFPLKLLVEVPKGGKLRKGTYDFTGDFHVEYRIIYPDSAIFFIGNNITSGSRLNIVNRYEQGIDQIKKEHPKDSVYFEGKQGLNRYWKENVLGEFIIGYVNVPSDRKAEFDKALGTLRRKE